MTFAAAAQGVAKLPADDLVTLQEGRVRSQSARLLVGAGTGLGVAALVPKESGWRTIGGEGGHIGFAPASEEQLAVWRHLLQPGGRVTAENVISGPGLAAIYASLRKVSPGNTAIADPAEIVAAVPANPLWPDVHSICSSPPMAPSPATWPCCSWRAAASISAAASRRRSCPAFGEGGFVRAFRERGAHAGLMSGFPIRVITQRATRPA
ncbi:MAG: glucokinase [Rhodocyclaceae bacterium]|nr:glucokinase [Rhodocyclaceae bacterium]